MQYFYCQKYICQNWPDETNRTQQYVTEFPYTPSSPWKVPSPPDQRPPYSLLSMWEQYAFLFKIVVIGDTGVGKTNLVSQFVDDKFLDDEKPTVGVEFSSKVVNICNHEIRCQIWDTAGQERFRAVTKAYYNGAVGALVVFDLANSKTFENIAKWIEEAEENTKKETVILIIGNKADLPKREVSQSKVEELMSRKKGTMLFMETSALTGHNVREAFEALVKGIYEQKQREIDSLRKQNVKPEEEPSNIPPSPKKQNVITLKSQTVPTRESDSPKKPKKKCC